MTYTQWRTTSTTAQEYAATSRCNAVFALPALQAAVRDAEAEHAAAKKITDLKVYKARADAATAALESARRALNAAKDAAMTTQERQRRADRRAANLAEMAAEEDARHRSTTSWT